MKTVLRKGSLSTGAVSGGLRPARPGLGARPSPAAAKPPPPPANPYKLTPAKKKSSNSTVWIVVGVVAVVVIGIILVAASGGNEEPVRAVVQAPQPVVSQSSGPASEVGKPDPRLGGKTWAEASKEAERNSKMMQARKSAMKGYPKR